MSLLSSVEWEIRIARGAVSTRCRTAAVTRRGLRRTVREQRSDYASADGQGMPAWQGALDVLAAQLPEASAGRSRAYVVLPDSLVRYAVIPCVDALANAAEEAVFLQHRFSQLYDEPTAAWQIRVDRAHGSRPRLASAVDPALIAALQALLRARGIRLCALTPALADTVNRYRASFSEPAAWLVRHDSGVLCMARWHDWGWAAARSFCVEPGWRSQLGSLLTREECMHDVWDGARTAYVVDEPDAPAPVASLLAPGWDLRILAPADAGGRTP